MSNKSYFWWLCIIVAIAIVYGIAMIVSGLIKVFLILLGALLIVSLLIDFISKKFPNSKLGKMCTKVLSWVKEFLEEALPFI